MCVVEPEQKRSAATLCVLAVATDHAVGGSQLLHLPHRALALMVRLVAGLGDHAVKRTTTGGQPSLGLVEPGRHRRKDKVRTVNAGMERLLHVQRSEEHTSELQSLMRISYAVFCLKKKKRT